MTTINIDSKSFGFETVVRSNSFKISEIGRKWKTSAVFKLDEAVWIVQVFRALGESGYDRGSWFKNTFNGRTITCFGKENKAGKYVLISAYFQVGKAKHLVVPEGRERSGWASFAVGLAKTTAGPSCRGAEQDRGMDRNLALTKVTKEVTFADMVRGRQNAPTSACSGTESITKYVAVCGLHSKLWNHKTFESLRKDIPGAKRVICIVSDQEGIIVEVEKGESFFSFARDMTLKSTKAMVQAVSLPQDLGPWRSKLLWASRVLPMPLVGLLVIGSVCADTESEPSDYPELEALARLDFGAAMKIFLAKRLTSEFTLVTAEVEEKSVIIGERNRVATEALWRSISEGNNRIAVLYGGGHMPDLGRRLREEFNLVPSRVQWVTAWSIRNRELESRSLPFLKTLARISGWPLNRYQTLALVIFSSVLALDLLFWELFFGTALNWISQAASDISHFVENSQGL
ncbi:hypothetical protein IFM89_017280 [Coptis chinensis]|uniref:Uncharacterized protein n=2 Tax=Coptis chinensis TaxID=261450 RepID=A0A835I8D0_9MAGN|nr:hypothetical protein IFM89_017280 [Coptis chinensis]